MIYKSGRLFAYRFLNVADDHHQQFHDATTSPSIVQISETSVFRPTKKSLVISKLSQLLAILGATLSKFGTMPLYKPLTPSCAIITFTASNTPLY